MVEPIAIATCGTTLMLNSDDLRRDRRPFSERKAALARLRSCDGIQYGEHAEGHCNKMFAAVCDLGLEGVVSKKLNAPPYGLSKRWIKVKESKGIGGDACSGRDILQQQSERAANLMRSQLGWNSR